LAWKENPVSENAHLPEVTVAYREYRISLNGLSGSVGISLGRPDADTMPCRFARHVRASAYGLVSIVGLDAAPQKPIVWILAGTKIGLTVQGRDGELSVDLRRLIARYLGVFFADIEPELTVLRTNLDIRPGRTLH
jgi:hypothetical protein